MFNTEIAGGFRSITPAEIRDKEIQLVIENSHSEVESGNISVADHPLEKDGKSKEK